jgi:hypothetical protein
VRNNSRIEKRRRAPPSEIQIVSDYHYVTGVHRCLHRADSRETDDVRGSRHLEGTDIGAIVDAMRGYAVMHSVTGKKQQLCLSQLATQDRTTRKTVGCFDIETLHLGESRYGRKSAATDNCKR